MATPGERRDEQPEEGLPGSELLSAERRAERAESLSSCERRSWTSCEACESTHA